MSFRVACFALLACATALGAENPGPVEKMEALRVGGAIPLVKVGDYRLKVDRFGAAAVAEGDYVYVVGGGGVDGAPLDSIERFNIRTNKSEIFAHLRTGRLWVRAVLHDHKIYVLGGHAFVAGQFADQDTTEIVDLATGKVSWGPQLPFAGAHLGVALLEDKIYVVGGRRTSADGVARLTNDMQVFDFGTGKWSEGPNMPTPRDVLLTTAAGLIVAAGGYNGSKPLDVVEVFDPRSNRWHILPSLVAPVSGNSAAVLGHHLFLLGDYDQLGRIVAYDLRRKTSEVFALQYLRTRHTAAVTHEGRIYVVGGKLEFRSALDYVQVYEQPKPDAPKS